ncbi:hypothetical protein SEUCBS140593_010404 [Sporothrix eucalyptigena]|uniref:Uncharacterized protein n=1 Tax=Sporothrix eucalyptigena TaxID=1812306 RepID=A0ABP0D1E3_9PEZI
MNVLLFDDIQFKSSLWKKRGSFETRTNTKFPEVTVNQANGRQPRLTSHIIAFAANISHTSELIPKLERPDQYAIVGEYLIKTFNAVLARMMIGRVAIAPQL